MPGHAHPPFRVAVIGPGTCSAARREQARSIGRLLAEAGAIVVCGGLGGVMDAVARGCREAGGTSVGFLPRGDVDGASKHLTLPLPTGLGEARNHLVVGTSEVVIALGGGSGTLSEMALAWKLGRPLVALDSWNVLPPSDATPPDAIPVQSAEQAVATALEQVRAARAGHREALRTNPEAAPGRPE